MNFRTAVLIAFGLAFGLPYITIALLETGDTIGPFLVAGLFIGVIFIVIWSDFNSDEDAAGEKL